ncbi:hypothetical protein I9018_04275 [Pseudomonas sp. MPFS]|uniref:hypothetical protein n=1 Tax=Pseudomonas sp. MPFS TaxID=2795724 RepID=UPI001F1356BA|nr:hypothetical protein [Pseudomonas sp. MPFS]UMZ12924.1 hypothetical protein I9018_04275 [Pseudomonas sp. MPFS]
MKLREFLDSTHLRMPFATKWVGRTGIVLGPILGLLHLLAAAVMRPYSQHVVEQYDAVQRMGNLLAAPAAQYFILFGFSLCLLWFGLWVARIGLAIRSWIIRRRAV